MRIGALALLPALLDVVDGHTKEEILAKGREVLEEYRRDQGHWVDAHTISVVEHAVDHVGADGLAIAGFFLHSNNYRSSASVSTAEQGKDAGFVAFRKVAQEQHRWIGETGVDNSKVRQVACSGIPAVKMFHCSSIVPNPCAFAIGTCTDMDLPLRARSERS